MACWYSPRTFGMFLRSRAMRSVPAWLSTHPTGTDRIARLRKNIPKVRGLYQQAIAGR